MKPLFAMLVKTLKMSPKTNSKKASTSGGAGPSQTHQKSITRCNSKVRVARDDLLQVKIELAKLKVEQAKGATRLDGGRGLVIPATSTGRYRRQLWAGSKANPHICGLEALGLTNARGKKLNHKQSIVFIQDQIRCHESPLTPLPPPSPLALPHHLHRILLR